MGWSPPFLTSAGMTKAFEGTTKGLTLAATTVAKGVEVGVKEVGKLFVDEGPDAYTLYNMQVGSWALVDDSWVFGRNITVQFFPSQLLGVWWVRRGVDALHIALALGYKPTSKVLQHTKEAGPCPAACAQYPDLGSVLAQDMPEPPVKGVKARRARGREPE